MTRNLCISVMFLDRTFHGRVEGDGLEWPPSPMRLFQALVAGAHAGCRDSEWCEAEVNAFSWLEALQPPMIIAPTVQRTSDYSFFVPDNVADKAFERGQRLVTKTAQSNTLLDGDTIHYLWRLEEKQEEHQYVDTICREARHMLALGWGIDQVVGNGRVLDEAEVALLSGRRWRPWIVFRPDEYTLRVPISGSLANLRNVHQSFLRRIEGNIFHPVPETSRFDTVAYLNSNTLPPRSYASFELPDSVSFHQENAVRIAAMLRSLACDCAKSDTHDFPGGSEVYVAGHTSSQNSTPPRFSYLPIPSIGGDYADGMIRRLLIVEPLEGNGAHARWAQQRLRGSVLTDENSNERGRLLDPWRQTSRTMFQRYTGESSTWCTVTPVVLPGYDDRSYAKAEKLLLASIGQAGLPVNAISDFSIRKSPFFPGSQHPRQYFLPNYLRGWPGWHVRLHFREPVPGPLVVGAGRHIGLGLFAQCEE